MPVPQDKFGQQRGTGTTQRPRPGQSGPKAPEKSELTDKEIQDQIKATLARLSGGGKSKASKLRKARREERAEEQRDLEMQESGKKTIQVTEFVTANELAKLMEIGRAHV